MWRMPAHAWLPPSRHALLHIQVVAAGLRMDEAVWLLH